MTNVIGQNWVFQPKDSMNHLTFGDNGDEVGMNRNLSY